MRSQSWVDSGDEYNKFLMDLERLPGVRRKSVSTVFGALKGRVPYTTIVEVVFDNREAMEAALMSEAGQEAGQNLINFGGSGAYTLYMDVMEENYEAD